MDRGSRCAENETEFFLNLKIKLRGCSLKKSWKKRDFWLNFFYYAHTNWHNLIQVNWDVCHHVSCVCAKIDEDRTSLKGCSTKEKS